MNNIAVECLKHPSKPSIWVPELGRYVCPESESGQLALSKIDRPKGSTDSPELTINSQFKLVFLTAVFGTFFFIAICVALHLYTNGKPPPALDKLIIGLLDMAKIGFGAVVGLLGSKALQSSN